MYTTRNFKTKKELREAVAQGQRVSVIPDALASRAPSSGTVYLEGPHAPAPHTWYAVAKIRDGLVIEVK